MLINNRYLIIPSSNRVQTSKLKFYEGNKLILDLDVFAEEKNPEYFAYYDMKRFLGQDIEIKADKLSRFDFTNSIEEKVVEETRPLIHFTCQSGWINDPNAPIFYEGKYHLFFQWNPVGRLWANMHWGHAVSDDLINWKQLDCVLYPDEMGDMFSGSAIVDHKNILGLKENQHETVVLFYSASGNRREINQGKGCVQCIAYSTDGMKTFKKYEGNPIIPAIKIESRDPKVIYHEESGMYIMALYLGAGEFSFFKSANLTDWTYLNSYQHPTDRECPDFYRFGDKYILAAANDYYVVGSFDINKGFTPEKEPVRLGYGCEYASQTFFGTKDKIKICWNIYNNLPVKNFNCTMSLPYKLEFDGEYLKNIPLIESEKLYEYEKFVPGDRISLPMEAYDFEMDIPEDCSLKLFGNPIDIEKGRLRIKTLNGGTTELPVSSKIRIISDTYGLEIFTDDYRKFAAFETVNEFGENVFETSKELKNLKIGKVKH